MWGRFRWGDKYGSTIRRIFYERNNRSRLFCPLFPFGYFPHNGGKVNCFFGALKKVTMKELKNVR